MARTLSNVKEARRAKISALLDEYGQAPLAEMTGIAAAYLWQMGKGEGAQRRGVSDENAAKIEKKLNKPSGWLSGETAGTDPSQPATLDPAKLGAAIKFADDLFKANGKVFDPAAQIMLLAGIYAELLATPEPNTVEMATRYGRVINEGQRAIAGAGQDDRGRAGEGAAKAKAKAGRKR